MVVVYMNGPKSSYFMGSVLCNMPTSALLSSDGDVEKLEASDPGKPAFTPELSAIPLLLGET